MLKITRIVDIVSKNYIKQTWRRCALSVREKAWQESRRKYEKYDHILYSSYLEVQEEQAGYKRRTVNTYKTEQEKRRKTHVANLYDTDKAANGYNNMPHEGEEGTDTSTYPKNWMDDYEFYEGVEDGESSINSLYGTADPTIPVSKVPCSGCGALLHCTRTSLPGYIPMEIFKGRSDKELKTIVCQRCHFLKRYNILLDVEVAPESYAKTVGHIRNEYALAIIVVDLTDFPCSIWSGMQELLGQKRPIFIVGNKVDLLPRDSNQYLEHVKNCLKQQVTESGIDGMNIKHISLVSAKTGYGIEELITQLQKIWLYKGDVYLFGCTNVGKSSLFNILLKSDYCRPEATELIRKATTCPWPGTTLKTLKFPILRPSEIRVYQRFRRLFSERAQKSALDKLRRDQANDTGSIKLAELIGNVGRTFDTRDVVNDSFAMSEGTQPIITLNERSKDYQRARWFYDTPGVMHPDQISNMLTTQELIRLYTNRMISPRAFRLNQGMSLFLAGLGRLDFLSCTQVEVDWVKVFVFSSLQLPVVICETVHANEVYSTYLGTELLGVPCGNTNRLTRWPGLQCKSDEILFTGTNEHGLSGDITVSSAGWIGLQMAYGNKCTFRVWTPHARGIYMRTPSLIPHAERLIGKRIRNSLAYNLSKPFVFRK